MAALSAKRGLDAAALPPHYRDSLVRAVGLNERVELEQSQVQLREGDIFLLCTDGLTRMVSDEILAKILKQGLQNPLGSLARNLVDAANEAGGRDNITVILVKVGDIGRTVSEENEESEVSTLAFPVSVAVFDTADCARDEAQTPRTLEALQCTGDQTKTLAPASPVDVAAPPRRP